jgi:hypothetical protein
MKSNRFRLSTVLAVACLLAIGCGRPFYRQQADADAYCLTDQKAALAGSSPDEYRIAIDPRSRMFDPNNPDMEPMPPDDPTSNRYMQCVDCREGSKCWRCLPRTGFVDNPAWQQYLPRNAQGQVQLDMRGAVDMALLQSPRYQTELEQLYLSALDVSFERFRFDAQFFGGSEIFLTSDGPDRAGSGGDSSTVFEVSPLRPGNRLRAEKLTATGGELVVGAANSMMWQFAGPNDYTSTTLLDFSLLQPLLRAGGRTVVLERLTIAERALLGNVRQMERYRRGFYLNIVTGRDAGQGPSRRGGFFGGSGLEGFAGVGGGGFGNVGNFGFGGGQFGQGQGVGGGFTGGAGAAGAGGYIGLLQSAQVIRNQRSNVASLRESFEQLQASHEAGRIDRFQVDLAKQALYNAQSQLVTAEAGYQTSLDSFKIDLGLPPELDVKIADPFLDRFNLLDPAMDAAEADVNATLNAMRRLRQVRQENQPEAPQENAAQVEQFNVLLAQVADHRRATEQRSRAIDADLQALDASLPQRRQYLERLSEREEVRDAQIDASLFDVTVLDARVQKRREEFVSLQQQLNGIWAQLDEVRHADSSNIDDRLPAAIDALSELSGRLLELSLVQAGARLEAVTFDPVDLSDEEALLIASAYRRDWQNARAQLVDAWRLIYFNANALMADLNLIFSGDISNVGDNPFDIKGSTGRLRMGLQWDAPLTRLAERNKYRQALIEYQQARRTYYQFRDRVSQSLRFTLRQIRLDEINFELRRAAVLVAISQVDLTQLRLSEPPQPAVAGEPATAQFSVTTARDLVQSLSDLLNVQNDFLSVWVNYEVQRMALDYDLGIMELDPAGNRVEHNVPLAAYIAGAEAIRAQQCNVTDLYPGITLGPASTPAEGEPIEPLRPEGPNSLDPAGPEMLPAPLVNPAANVIHRVPRSLDESPIQVVLASATGEPGVLPPPSVLHAAAVEPAVQLYNPAAAGVALPSLPPLQNLADSPPASPYNEASQPTAR